MIHLTLSSIFHPSQTLPKARKLISSCSPRDVLLYTDGSHTDDGRSGASWVIYLNGTTVRTGRTDGHPISTAFDAEALALKDDLRDVLSLPACDLAGKLLVFIDNPSVGDVVGRNSIPSSQSLLLEAEVLLHEWRDTPYRPGLGSHDAEIVWVPGHEGFEGNEAADAEARAAAASSPPSSPPRA